MPSTFIGIEIGSSGLMASQVGQDITGHNIANANTPGYSVQSVDMQAADPFTPPDLGDHVHTGMIGTGVLAGSVTRARDQFLDVQVRNGLSGQSTQTAQSDALTQVEQAFGEPSNTGLSHAMTSYFQSFNELANNPEDLGVRNTVVQSGAAMASVFQSTQGRLDVISQQITSKINTDMGSLNSYGQQIAALNITIRQAVAQHQQPNDLMDRRDQLIDKIAALGNVTVVNNADGTVNVAIGTSDLVVGTDAHTLTLSGMNARGDLQGGELAGLAQAQTEISGPNGYQSKLDALAANMISQMNAQQAAGRDLNGAAGIPFFTGTDARSIAVNPTLLADPTKLAAAAGPPAPFGVGDATNATAMAALENAPVTNPISPLYNQTMPGFYQQFVSDAGGRAATALTAADSAKANLAQLTQQRASVSGVATDTEMVNMLKFQRAYEASARVVKTMDDMLGTLINNMLSA